MKSLISALTAVCVACIAAVFLGAIAGGLNPASAWFALFCGAAAGGCAWLSMSGTLDAMLRRKPPGPGALEETDPVRGWVEWGVIVAFALFALRAFCWLIFWKDGDIAFISPNNLGDLSLHITHIRYLANGAPFWPDNPIYAGSGLHYPFGVDLFNSLLLLVGIPVERGLIWVGLLGALATAVALRRWGGSFAMAGFLFSGGIAGFAIFETMHWDGGHLTMELQDYQDRFQALDGSWHSLAWKSIPLALFVTQRGLLYAIPAGLALLWSWRARLFRVQRSLPFWIEVLLYATMPLFHLHTFIFLSILLGFWSVTAMLARRVPVFPKGWVRDPEFLERESLKLIAWAFVPASVLVWLLTGFHGNGTIHLKAGWMQDEPFFIFWFRNFGFLPFAVAGLLAWLGFRKSDDTRREAAAFVIPAVGFFFVTCFVMFAAWEWDNTKLMIWCYFAVLPALWTMLREFSVWIRGAACIALFFSGFVSLWGGLDGSHQGYPLANREELNGLQDALRGVSVTATFGCYPTFNHPILLLGHKVAVGYPGHLGSHGIDYKPRKEALESLLRGDPGWKERARELKLDFLFWGSRERKEYAASKMPWREELEPLAQGDWGAIYDLREITRGR